ncbi:MAG: DNA mismatch repair endonuclease MutL [Proteobacteria bacterium]|nr:DNA mismatch repair endonuclease MutL [Pseudomonadota bacterium]
MKLNPSVVDQIAAGEVVERPAHLVKELVENSLDAGATKLRVTISNGARNIQVSDNGRGIRTEELELALERFATSKIRRTEDLWQLSSYGFRGEALASISAVSDLTLITRMKNSESAQSIRSQFGQKEKPHPVGGALGTTVIIENLFENLPARLKFMKSPASEVAQIKNVIKAFALSHPEVEFSMLVNSELILDFPVVKESVRAQMVLGLDELYAGEAERSGYKARAYFSSPHDVQKTSKNIWIFVQKRWVQDRGLQAAVMEAYRNLLMHGEYPSVAIELEVPPEQIDVNIHPTKSQVKFLDPSLAFRAVQGALRSALEQAPWLKKQSQEVVAQESGSVSERNEVLPPLQNLSFDGGSLGGYQFKQKRDFLAESTFSYASVSSVKPALALMPGETPLQGYWSSLQPIGQVALTYLVAQSSNSMILIDQHAAHERVMFERLLKALTNGGLEIQDFLFPLAIDLSEDKCEVLLKHQESFSKLGILFEQLGPSTLGVKSSPVFIKDSALSQSLEIASQQLLEFGGSGKVEEVIKDACARMACHSSVRAGQAMTLPEIKSLLESMDEFPLSSFCPHGRPVSQEISFYQLDKDFGRLGS